MKWDRTGNQNLSRSWVLIIGLVLEFIGFSLNPSSTMNYLGDFEQFTFAEQQFASLQYIFYWC